MRCAMTRSRRALADKGITVYAEDHLGHGKTAGSPDKVGHYSDRDGAFLKIVEDMHTLEQRMREESPGLPVFPVRAQHGIAAFTRIRFEIRKRP